MFKITGHRGFQVTFKNGWTVSVQFGGGHYCDNYDVEIGSEKYIDMLTSGNAEVAAWDKDDKWYVFDNHDTVWGRVEPDELLKFMKKIAKRGK